MIKYNNKSLLEKIFLEKFKERDIYPEFEKIKTFVVPSFSFLGKIVALRFIEWLQLNPEGIICLPTGKTPEYFIKWTEFFLKNWNKKEVQKEIKSWGLSDKKPELKNYYFFQIDEFFPMNPERENSFSYYIRKFYVEKFGFSPEKVFLMDTWNTRVLKGKNYGDIFPDERVDLSLRYRAPRNEMEELQKRAIFEIDQYAMEYEEKIEKYGSIGFFLGGIGPDGHIAFNIRGSDHNSTTRVLNINYETAAASSVDLGGIEIARNKCALTIGLKTITKNPTTTAIIMAAGESKAKIVKESIENPSTILYPATALQKLEGARFYITQGAASLLTGRRIEKIKKGEENPEKIIIDICHKKRIPLSLLTEKDIEEDLFGKFIKGKINVEKEKVRLQKEIKKRIERGIENVGNTVFLHTSPHHDDIMLGYLPYILHLVRNPTNIHYFATFTSGFTSVTNKYLLEKIENLEKYLQKGILEKLFKEKDYFAPKNIMGKNRDVFQYLDGVAANSIEMKEEGEARRMLRNLVEIVGEFSIPKIKRKIKKIKDYLQNAYPGQRAPSDIQKLKGMIREWEEELLWAHLGINCNYIFHLRLGFYTGEIFTPTPEFERDIKPTILILEKIKPDIITVAFDPEATGPDTHYKVLQIVAESIKIYTQNNKKKIKIWGYRNIWDRFHPSEANIYVPVSMNSFAIMNAAFDICFGSQRSASFPSYEYDGPFSKLAQKIMVEQFSILKNCLGRDFFYKNPVPRLRATRGFVFIREMNVEEFLSEAYRLKEIMNPQI